MITLPTIGGQVLCETAIEVQEGRQPAQQGFCTFWRRMPRTGETRTTAAREERVDPRTDPRPRS